MKAKNVLATTDGTVKGAELGLVYHLGTVGFCKFCMASLPWTSTYCRPQRVAHPTHEKMVDAFGCEVIVHIALHGRCLLLVADQRKFFPKLQKGKWHFASIDGLGVCGR